MKIRNGCHVTIHYTLTDDEGQVIDSSQGYEPLEYMQGEGEIIPGLEAYLEGEDVGFSGKVTVQPEQGYGPYEPGLIIRAQRENFPDDMPLEVGMQVQTEMPDGAYAVFVVKEMTDAGILLDGNHPLAGKQLHFDVEVVDVQHGALAGESGS